MNGLINHVEATHEEDSFKIIRAVHLFSWSEKLDEVPFLSVQEWTEFDHFKTLRLSLWCVDNGYMISQGEDTRPETRRFALKKKGQQWVYRR